MSRVLAAVAVVLYAAEICSAHRLDEYLQATILSFEHGRVVARMTLTPGVAVYPFVVAAMDADRDGAISAGEERAYAVRILQDQTLLVDGRAVALELFSWQFPAVDEIKDGVGEIHVEYSAKLPTGAGRRKLTLQNRHEGRISAYQVNCLVSRDKEILIGAQHRNVSQSVYELNFSQAGGQGGRLGMEVPVAAVSALGIGFMAVLRRRR